jgi:hypothetical protein
VSPTGVVGVQRREHEVAGERRLDRDLAVSQVADLADQHPRSDPGAGSTAARREREPIFGFTSICPMPGSWISTGSSTVMMFTSSVLMRERAP